MHSAASTPSAGILQAFEANEAQQRIPNTKVGCALVVFLMPAGSLLDYYACAEKFFWPFFELRLVCSALAAVIWVFLFTKLGQRSGRFLGVVVPLLPVAFIACMICVDRGFESPYYAGLNLVLLAIGAVLHWSLLESVIAVFLVLLIYIAAGILHGHLPGRGDMVNNFYFIGLMDITLVVGTYFQQRARFREFELRFELDNNRKQLEESNRKLRDMDEAKGRFFANISHELRTPLTLLLAPIEALRQRFKLDDETSDLLGTMQANGMRLLKLINDLLDLVRLESGRMEVKLEPVELSDLFKGLASAARQVANDKRLQLETFVDPSLGLVLIDHDKLEKIVLNLVFNALKFTPAGGRVELRAERQAEQFTLTVADTGMGISEKNLPHVFDRFWQADDSSKRKYQGVGIGLALVKELVELQAGQVSVASQEGKGTTFTIRLPYRKAEAPVVPAATSAVADDDAASSPATTAHSEEWLANLYRRAELFPALTPVRDSMRPVETWTNGDRPRVLVADDEPDMLRFLKSQLREQYQVLEAVDGEQAVEKARQFLPDLIVLDMMMPEKDGLQACRELRDQTTTQSIPIILLTARADEETKLAALKAGASDFLTKPFSSTELHVRIRNLVDSYHYQRKVAKQNHVLERTIDQLKATESELVESEKMRSLGQLSAGMIHEINNPLNFATTGLFSLRRKATLVPDTHRPEFLETVDDVEEGVRRVKDLVSKMREFSHADNAAIEQVDISQALNSALRFLSHEWKGRVDILQHVPEGQFIWANRNRMIQVLLNLLHNALDALARKPFEGEKPTIWIESRTEADRKTLVIRDNGPGIASEHMDKIFDPFFTTKDVGQGMGLGLSICYRIVQDYAGRIFVRSELGSFCEFRLEFPADRPAEETAEIA